MVVEGEKCVEAVEKFFPNAIVTTWSGGAGNELHTDWTPLEGRDLLLVSDAEKKGRDTMLAIAKRLAEKCGEIKVVLSPGEDGTDIFDWLAAGGAPEAARIIGELAETFGKPKPEPELVPEPTKEQIQHQLPDNIDKNAHFEILGNSGDAIVVMLSTSRVLYVSQDCDHTTLNLDLDGRYPLANRHLAHAESLTPKNCQFLGSTLIRAADRKRTIRYDENSWKRMLLERRANLYGTLATDYSLMAQRCLWGSSRASTDPSQGRGSR